MWERCNIMVSQSSGLIIKEGGDVLWLEIGEIVIMIVSEQKILYR